MTASRVTVLHVAGKGTQVWKKSGDIYDGDWQAGLRHGFGMLSVRDESGEYMKRYSGGWKNDMRHVSSIIIHSESGIEQ